MEGNPREIESVVIVDSFVDQLAAKREPMQVLLSCLSSASFKLGRQETAPRPLVHPFLTRTAAEQIIHLLVPFTTHRNRAPTHSN